MRLHKGPASLAFKALPSLLLLAALALQSSFMAGVLADCGSDGHYIVGYYPSWKRADLQNISWDKLTHVQLAFGIPKSDGTISYDGDWFTSQVVSQAHSNNVSVTLSVGGWTGSSKFSDILKNSQVKGTFIDSIVSTVRSSDLDGIDIDWEYPGRLGDNCNVFDPQNDANNFKQFLKELRERFDKEFGTSPDTRKIISLAVRVEPFDTPSGPLTDVSEFAESVDFASIMAFDINGAWSNTTGPLAPFNYEQGKGDAYSVTQA
ncbi:hypothetical protein EV182_006605, partial [Spiromyces aspiralis]